MKIDCSWRALGVLVASSGLMACASSETPDEELGTIVLRSQSHGPAPYVLEAKADTTVRTDLDIRRNDNYGCTHIMEVGTGRGGNLEPEGAPDAMRSLLRFDLQHLPPENVLSAKLQLTLDSFDFGSSDSVYTIDAHRVLPSGPLTPWIEGDGFEGPQDPPLFVPPGCSEPDAAFGVAWVGGPDPLNEQGATLGLDNQTQPSFDGAVVGSVTIHQATAAPGDVFEIDVTSLVNDWLSGAGANHGLVLRDVTTNGIFRGARFGTKEGEAAGGVRGPRLRIVPDSDVPWVEITADGSVATLQWEPVPGATYSVYRSTDPDFMFTDPGATLVATGLTGGEYVDDFPQPPLFPYNAFDYDDGVWYRVVEHTVQGDASSAVVGRIRFAFSAMAGTSTRYGKLPLCLTPTPADAHLQRLLDEQPEAIHWWQPALQSYASDTAPFTSVLERKRGEVLTIQVPPIEGTDFVTYQLAGRVPDPCELVTTLHEGINVVTWPVTAGVSTPPAVLAALPEALATGWWGTFSQSIARFTDGGLESFPWPYQPWSVAFPYIEPCSAVFLYIDTGELPEGTPLDLTWPPGVAACEPS